jgi:hypothetical protein
MRFWMAARERGQHTDVISQAQARVFQIDAVRYMHMALPPDLTPAEVTSLRTSLPESVLGQSNGEFSRRNPPTFLRKMVAQVVSWFMAVAFIFLPLFAALLNSLLKYERDHQVTQRLLASVQNTAQNLGERGINAQMSVIRALDSPTGRRLVGTGFYLAEGIGGGLIDGYRNANGDALVRNPR